MVRRRRRWVRRLQNLNAARRDVRREVPHAVGVGLEPSLACVEEVDGAAEPALRHEGDAGDAGVLGAVTRGDDDHPPFDFLTLLQKSQFKTDLVRTFAQRQHDLRIAGRVGAVEHTVGHGVVQVRDRGDVRGRLRWNAPRSATRVPPTKRLSPTRRTRPAARRPRPGY